MIQKRLLKVWQSSRYNRRWCSTNNSNVSSSIFNSIFDESATKHHRNSDEAPFTPFDDHLSNARNSAKKSLLIQVQSKESVEDLIRYCKSNFGEPKALHFHHNVGVSQFENFYLVEFESEEIVQHIISQEARHRPESHFPICSPFLWLSKGKSFRQSISSSNVPLYYPPDLSPLYSDDCLGDVIKLKSSVSYFF